MSQMLENCLVFKHVWIKFHTVFFFFLISKISLCIHMLSMWFGVKVPCASSFLEYKYLMFPFLSITTLFSSSTLFHSNSSSLNALALFSFTDNFVG